MIVYTLEQRLKRAYDRLTEDADFGGKIIFSNEPLFDLGGYVNKQNCSIWGKENPHACIEIRFTQNESLFGVEFGPET